MQNVICFAIGNKNYVNPMRISIGSFCSYNNSKLIVYLTDNSSDYFNSEFHYNNVEFIDIGETQSKKSILKKIQVSLLLLFMFLAKSICLMFS